MEELAERVRQGGGAAARVLLRAAARSLLFDPEMCVRITAGEILDEFGTLQDARALWAAFPDPEWAVRATYASALGSCGLSKSNRDRLALVAETDPDYHVRGYAAYALGYADRREYAERLAKQFASEETEWGQVVFLGALFMLEPARYMDELLGRFTTQDWTIAGLLIDTVTDAVDLHRIDGEQIAYVRWSLEGVADREPADEMTPLIKLLRETDEAARGTRPAPAVR